jgi:hypothetical protein
VVTSTFLVTLFAPLFFVMIEKSLGRKRRPAIEAAALTPALSH